MKGKVLRFLLVACLTGGIGAAGLLGWQWQATLRCNRIDVYGGHHVHRDTLIALARVDTSMLLFSIDPTLVEDRVVRHPWVRWARAVRLPTGTLSIRVAERRPAVLVVDGRGTPSHYLDAAGFQMPLLPEGAYDVPLLRGLKEPYHPVRRVTEPQVLELLTALAGASPGEDALFSELEMRPSGEVWLYTSPTERQGTLPVRLGRGGYAEKLDLLYAFWHQAVLPQQDKTFTSIDLRFDSQVVTQEEEVHGP